MYSKEDQLRKVGKVKNVSTFGKKRSVIKKKAKKIKDKDFDLFDKSITVRLSQNEIKKRVEWIKCTFSYCQICGSMDNLDYPHHALDGVSRKDDRTMIDICVLCHRHIHTKGFDGLAKTREQVEAIGWENNEKYLGEKNECI